MLIMQNKIYEIFIYNQPRKKQTSKIDKNALCQSQNRFESHMLRSCKKRTCAPTGWLHIVNAFSKIYNRKCYC